MSEARFLPLAVKPDYEEVVGLLFFASAVEPQNTLEKCEQGRKPLVGKRNRALADSNALFFHVRFPNIMRFCSGCIGFRNVPFFDALAPGRPSKFLTLIGATRYDKVP